MTADYAAALKELNEPEWTCESCASKNGLLKFFCYLCGMARKFKCGLFREGGPATGDQIFP